MLYRDFKHIVPFMVQIMMYVTPVIYPAHLITVPLYRWILSLNPMFGIVTAYRSCILGLDWDFPCLAISTVSAVGHVSVRCLLFPQDRTLFRRCCVTAISAISSSDLQPSTDSRLHNPP